jgi:diguanylate cyclase (GGDEF)-like protein
VKDEVAALDLLTGALGRELFEQKLAEAVSRARQEKAALSVLVIDVDELLEQNDLHGDAAGDEALGQLAELVCGWLDGRGPLGRLKGGTFAAVLPGVGAEEAQRLAERIRADCARGSFGSKSGPFSLTISVGVSQLRPGEPWGNVLDTAETACRLAKIGGRNQVAVR